MSPPGAQTLATRGGPRKAEGHQGASPLGARSRCVGHGVGRTRGSRDPIAGAMGQGSPTPFRVSARRLHNLLNDQCYFAFFSHHPLRRAQSCYVTLLHSKHWANVTLEPSSHSFFFSMTGNTCRVRRVALSCGVSLRRRLAARESREQITSTPMPSRRARALGGCVAPLPSTHARRALLALGGSSRVRQHFQMRHVLSLEPVMMVSPS